MDVECSFTCKVSPSDESMIFFSCGDFDCDGNFGWVFDVVLYLSNVPDFKLFLFCSFIIGNFDLREVDFRCDRNIEFVADDFVSLSSSRESSLVCFLVFFFVFLKRFKEFSFDNRYCLPFRIFD